MISAKAVKVIAADVMTGTVLDDNFEWFLGKPGQTKWERTFGNHLDAIAFCELQVRRYPDVEFCIWTDGEEDRRIVNQKWSR